MPFERFPRARRRLDRDSRRRFEVTYIREIMQATGLRRVGSLALVHLASSSPVLGITESFIPAGNRVDDIVRACNRKNRAGATDADRKAYDDIKEVRIVGYSVDKTTF